LDLSPASIVLIRRISGKEAMWVDTTWSDGNEIHVDCRTSQVRIEPAFRLPPGGAGQHIRTQSSLSEHWSEKPLPPMPKSWFEEDGGCFSIFGTRARDEFHLVAVCCKQPFSTPYIRLLFAELFFFSFYSSSLLYAFFAFCPD
jgi:hypothetical protein